MSTARSLRTRARALWRTWWPPAPPIMEIYPGAFICPFCLHEHEGGLDQWLAHYAEHKREGDAP